MAGKKKGKAAAPGNISIGGSVGPGSAVGPGARVQAEHIAGRDVRIGAEADAVADAFVRIHQAIQAKSFADEKTAQSVKEAVEVIQSENQKGDQASETPLKFSFNMLAQMAPDIFEVVVSTLANPMLGISAVVSKIAQKAKEEAGSAG